MTNNRHQETNKTAGKRNRTPLFPVLVQYTKLVKILVYSATTGGVMLCVWSAIEIRHPKPYLYGCWLAAGLLMVYGFLEVRNSRVEFSATSITYRNWLGHEVVKPYSSVVNLQLFDDLSRIDFDDGDHVNIYHRMAPQDLVLSIMSAVRNDGIVSVADSG